MNRQAQAQIKTVSYYSVHNCLRKRLKPLGKSRKRRNPAVEAQASRRGLGSGHVGTGMERPEPVFLRIKVSVKYKDSLVVVQMKV